MTISTQLDRTRIAELTAREDARLNENTQESGRTYERARVHLSGGVASSYQVREPWPIYLERGDGPKVWDVDGNEYFDFHNGFGSMVQGHANPAIGEAVNERYALGHALRGADRGRDRRRRRPRRALRACRSGATRTRAPRRRWTRSASPARTPAATP